MKSAYERWGCDGHSASWLSLKELLEFDYDQIFEDRRNGGYTCEPGKGELTTYKEFLGEGFFEDLEKLKNSGADRIVFWFDN